MPADAQAMRPQMEAAVGDEPTRSRRLLAFVRRYLIFVLLATLLALAGILQPAFLSPTNLIAVAYGSAIVGIVAMGQTLLLLTAKFDLSVAGTLGASGIVSLLVLPAAGVGGAIVAGLLTGMLVGVVNGLIITKTKASPFLVTLGTMSLLYGAGLAFTQSRTLYGDNEAFNVLGRSAVGPLPLLLLVFLVLAVLLQFVLSRTMLGRQLVAIGLNPSAARLSGIPVDRIVLALFAFSGLMAALGGIAMASRLNSITANAGLGFEFLTISAAVIGGTSLFGGRGGTLRTVMGVFVLGALNNVLILLGVDYASSAMVRGAVFLLVVGIDGLAYRQVSR